MPHPSYSLWVLLMFLGITMLSMMYYGQILYACAWIVASPLYVVARCCQAVLTWLQPKVRHEHEAMSFTWRSVLFSKVRIWYYDYVDEFVQTFLSFFPQTLQDTSMTIELQEVGEKVEYVPESQRDEPNPATFVFEKKPRKSIAERRDKVFGVEGGEVNEIRGATMRLEITKFQLVDWKNITNGLGEPVEFDEAHKDKLYDQLPGEIQQELEEQFGQGVRDYEQADDE